MGTFSERINKLIEVRCDGNQSKFARAIGVTSQRINQILKGSGELGMEPFYKVIIKFNVNPEWLLYEKGEIFADIVQPAYTHQNAEIAKVIELMEGVDDVGRGAILGGAYTALQNITNTHRAGKHKLPTPRSVTPKTKGDKLRGAK